MTELFYFPNEGRLCWIAGYTRDTNTTKVVEMTNDLTKNAKEFAGVAKKDIETIHTGYVYKSRRYKHMRFFYTQVDPVNVPEEAYCIQNPEWTMMKWLED